MITKIFNLLVFFVFVFSAGALFAKEEARISGQIVNGLRLLTITPGSSNDFIVYRGDYIQPSIVGIERFEMAIPELNAGKQFPVKEGEKAYIKIKKLGSYRYTAGGVNGTITVIEYSAHSYKAITADEAFQILKNTNPLILDVRTQMEYQQGRISGANLLPIQVISRYMDKLAPHRKQDILIYCATGNRSTVASRLLINNGFIRIYNLRHGIVGWAKKGYPVVR